MVECLNIHPNMHIIEIPGGEDRIEVIFKEIMTKNIPTTTRLLAGDLKKCYKSPSRINIKKITPRNITVNL